MSYLQDAANENFCKLQRNKYEIVQPQSIAMNCLQSKHTVISTSQSFSTMLKYWLREYCVARVKPTTYDSYSYCVNKYIIPFFDSLNIKGEDLSSENIQYFIEYIGEHSWLSQTYKRKIITVLKTATKKLFRNSTNYETLINAFDMPKIKNSQVEVFSICEQRRIESEILKSKDLKMYGILLAFYTGIRLGELCALRWEDFDFDMKTLSIKWSVSRTLNPEPHEKGRTKISLNSPKSFHSIRKIPLPGFLLTLLTEMNNGEIVKGNFVFSNKATPPDPRTYQRIYKKLIEKTGVPYRKFHAIRHTFATRALEEGVDVKTISELLGHSNVTITLNIYVHSLMKQKIIAIDKMDRLYKKQWSAAL